MQSQLITDIRQLITVICLFLLFSTPTALAAAAATNESACTIKAADTLPKIAGMKIGKSRVKEMPSPAGWPGSGPPLRVEVDFVAAGVRETWAYLCAVTEAGGAIVQRLAN